VHDLHWHDGPRIHTCNAQERDPKPEFKMQVSRGFEALLLARIDASAGRSHAEASGDHEPHKCGGCNEVEYSNNEIDTVPARYRAFPVRLRGGA
jgi:hypothetical protein